MQFPTSLLLIRHAAAAHNGHATLCGGHCDAPLTERGRLQVELLRRRLASDGPASACYTSPLRRARDTAAAAPPPLVPVPLDSLREIQVGPMEGTALDRVEAAYPDYWKRHLAHAEDDFCWPGGETYIAFRERALATLAELWEKHPGERVLVFTHAGFISQVAGALLGTPPGRWDLHRPANASITEVRWAGESGSLVAFDDYRHLPAPAG